MFLVTTTLHNYKSNNSQKNVVIPKDKGGSINN